MRILKACSRIEAGEAQELPVALHAPIYPPRPHFLALSPASDLHSGHASLLQFVSERAGSLIERSRGRTPKRGLLASTRCWGCTTVPATSSAVAANAGSCIRCSLGVVPLPASLERG